MTEGKTCYCSFNLSMPKGRLKTKAIFFRKSNSLFPSRYTFLFHPSKMKPRCNKLVQTFIEFYSQPIYNEFISFINNTKVFIHYPMPGQKPKVKTLQETDKVQSAKQQRARRSDNVFEAVSVITGQPLAFAAATKFLAMRSLEINVSLLLRAGTTSL